jgi:hypothetical protein
MDITSGQLFGRLTTIIAVKIRSSKELCWNCRCSCGEFYTVRQSALRSGATKSCGCYNDEIRRKEKHHLTHGLAGTPVYHAWQTMTARCLNKKKWNYKNYGGRGIKVCDRWLRFENFLEDMGEKPSSKHSLDRIDNNGDYCKANCRWATLDIQAQNKRRTIWVDGFALKTYCRMHNIRYLAVYYRLKQGMELQKALKLCAN